MNRAIFSLCFFIITAGANAKDLIFHANSGNNSELVNVLRITGKNTPYQKAVVYSVRIGKINNGSIIMAQAEAEFTNPYPYNVMVGSQLIITKSSDSTNGIELSEANGFNITPGMHHGVVVRTGTAQVNDSFDNYFVNFIAYAASDAVVDKKRILYVEKDYGRLSITVFE